MQMFVVYRNSDSKMDSNVRWQFTMLLREEENDYEYKV